MRDTELKSLEVHPTVINALDRYSMLTVNSVLSYLVEHPLTQFLSISGVGEKGNLNLLYKLKEHGFITIEKKENKVSLIIKFKEEE